MNSVQVTSCAQNRAQTALGGIPNHHETTTQGQLSLVAVRYGVVHQMITWRSMSRSVRLPCTRSGSRHGTALPSWLLLSADAKRVRDTGGKTMQCSWRAFVGAPRFRVPTQSKSRWQGRAYSGIGKRDGPLALLSGMEVARLGSASRNGCEITREVQRLKAGSRTEVERDERP